MHDRSLTTRWQGLSRALERALQHDLPTLEEAEQLYREAPGERLDAEAVSAMVEAVAERIEAEQGIAADRIPLAESSWFVSVHHGQGGVQVAIQAAWGTTYVVFPAHEFRVEVNSLAVETRRLPNVSDTHGFPEQTGLAAKTELSGEIERTTIDAYDASWTAWTPGVRDCGSWDQGLPPELHQPLLNEHSPNQPSSNQPSSNQPGSSQFVPHPPAVHQSWAAFAMLQDASSDGWDGAGTGETSNTGDPLRESPGDRSQRGESKPRSARRRSEQGGKSDP